MKLVFRKEHGEPRVAVTPTSARKLTRLGFELVLEPALGEHLGFTREAFGAAGATFGTLEPAEIDALVRVSPPEPQDLDGLKPGSVLLGLLEPFTRPKLTKTLVTKKLSSLCMELVPRTSYAQKMDALSSQASLAGYAAVIVAAERISKALPMMSTPAGTIAPARVFVIGVGVAGLQAIATAKRLGARVEAFDTRPVVAEQVRSLGAKFVDIDVGETGQTEQGYAKALTQEQLELQRRGMAKVIAEADIVITTAQLFGRPAPRIVTQEMLAGMRRGSVVVDLAASTGGNVAGSKPGEEVDVGGVRLLGLANFPAEVAKDASQVYANNVANLLEHLWDADSRTLKLDTEDDITDAVLLTHDAQLRDERVRDALEVES